MTSSLTIILLSVALSAFFSGMEIAFISSNKLRYELDKKRSGLIGKVLSVFFEHPEQFISTMLVGNNIALVVYGIQTARLLEPLLQNFIQSEFIILLLQTILSTLVILVTAEFLPKTVFRINPNFSLKVFAVPLLVFYISLFPVSLFATRFSLLILRVFGLRIPRQEEESVLGRIDLYNFLEDSYDKSNRESNMPLEHDVKIFQNALDFSKIKLRECIIPRTEIVAIDIDSSIEELTRKFIESGYSKILVYKENIDHIIGYIHSSELFKNPKNLRSRIIEIPIVPETMAASKLMETFMQKKRTIAVVVDEFGGTSGIVTLEDIMEEIFGEIEDEHDVVEHEARKVNDSEFILSGRLEIDYVNEKFNLDLPVSEDYETLAGFILHFHEKIPKVNERITIIKFTITLLKASLNNI